MGVPEGGRGGLPTEGPRGVAGDCGNTGIPGDQGVPAPTEVTATVG